MKQTFTLRERRWFGPLFGLFMGLITSLIHRRLPDWGVRTPLLTITALTILIYYAVPAWQTKIYRAWLQSVAPLGWIVSRIVLCLVYYGIVTPLGLGLRLWGYDPLQLRRSTERQTYWTQRSATRDAADYFRQF